MRRRPPGAFLGYLAMIVVAFGARAGWVGWRQWRSFQQFGPPRLEVGGQGIRVAAEGRTTLLAWADVAWLGTMLGVPPRRNAPALVAGLVPGATPLPTGDRLTLYRWYEPHPRWSGRLGVVRVFDLNLVDDSAAVASTLARFSGGRWRGEPPTT